jgi:hypothetical protein
MEFTSDGDLFIVHNGVRIAYRQAKSWVSLEPGFTVLDDHISDGPYGAIVIEYKDPHAH